MKKGTKVGPYEMGRELGRGATGTVYEGVDNLNSITMAIKMIKHAQNSKRALMHEIRVRFEILIQVDSGFHKNFPGDEGSWT